MKQQGILAVVSGFSGAGKGTLMKALLEKHEIMHFLFLQRQESRVRAKFTEENIFSLPWTSLRI